MDFFNLKGWIETAFETTMVEATRAAGIILRAPHRDRNSSSPCLKFTDFFENDLRHSRYCECPPSLTGDGMVLPYGRVDSMMDYIENPFPDETPAPAEVHIRLVQIIDGLGVPELRPQICNGRAWIADTARFNKILKERFPTTDHLCEEFIAEPQ